MRVLQKEPRGREVSQTDDFVFHNELNEKLYRIKVNSIQLKESQEENTATTERVFQDRQYQVCARVGPEAHICPYKKYIYLTGIYPPYLVHIRTHYVCIYHH